MGTNLHIEVGHVTYADRPEQLTAALTFEEDQIFEYNGDPIIIKVMRHHNHIL